MGVDRCEMLRAFNHARHRQRDASWDAEHAETPGEAFMHDLQAIYWRIQADEFADRLGELTENDRVLLAVAEGEA